MKSLQTNNEEETRQAGRDFCRELSPGAVVGLRGPLGAGKTIFVKGVAEALGIKEPVTSPTYTLISEYKGTLPLYHMDLYRLDSPEEFAWLGGNEMLYGQGICLVEWSERAGDLLPEDTWTVRFSLNQDGSRCLRFSQKKGESSL